MRALIEQLIYLTHLDRGEPSERHIADVSDVVSRVVGSAGPDGAATISVTAAPDARVTANWSEGSLIVSELEQILRQ